MSDPLVSVLEVELYDRTVGTLTNVGGDRVIFAFTEQYIEDEQRHVLSLSFKNETGGLLSDPLSSQRRLLPFFANLLPEGHLRQYLAERAGVNEQREFFLLWALGQDLPGAVTVRPAEGEALPPGLHDEGPEAAAARAEDALRFSLAGVQLKFSAVKEHGKASGLTIPARGVGGSWIVKLPSARFEGVPENEFAMMTLARGVGIDVPEFTLVDTDAIAGLPDGLGNLQGQKSYAIRRFDRSEDGAVHIEDFAQVFGVYPDDKYKKGSARSIARVLGIETEERDIVEFIRRLVFNALIGNADMHLKNWSLIYPDGRTPRLAPAYDFVCTIAYLEDENAALKFDQTKRFDRLTDAELQGLADRARLPQTLVGATAKETVERFREVWTYEKAHLPLTQSLRQTIDAHLARLPIYRTV